jgi:hypothetical protein
VKRYSQLTTYRFIVERSVRPSGVGVVQSDQLRAQWYRDFSPRMAAYMWLTSFRNKSLNNPGATTDRTYYTIEPGLRWKLALQWSLDGSYRYRRQKYDNSSATAESNAVFVAISYAWPRIAASR